MDTEYTYLNTPKRNMPTTVQTEAAELRDVDGQLAGGAKSPDAPRPEKRWPGDEKARAELGVVLVCYKGWQDTVECLESLLRSDIPIRVAVVDNASPDGSADQIIAWAEGRLPFAAPENSLGALTSPPLEKPIAIDVLDGEQALQTDPGKVRLVLIRSKDNLGFAGGNNLGMRHLFRDPHINNIWLLNNDTVVEPAAARSVLGTLKSDPWNGMVGTVIRYYHAPDTLQAVNGMTFNLLAGSNAGILSGKPASITYDPRAVARQSECVLGASLAVTRRFVETIGYMSEAYFLYFEEMDWARRNNGRFAIGFARGAVVYHKHGGSIGSSSRVGGRSPMSEYWLLRSRLTFYQRYHPVLLPLIWAQGCLQTARRLLRRQPASVKAMTKALFFRPF